MTEDREHGRLQYFYQGYYFIPLLKVPYYSSVMGGGGSYLFMCCRIIRCNNCSSTWLCCHVAAVAHIDDCVQLNSSLDTILIHTEH